MRISEPERLKRVEQFLQSVQSEPGVDVLPDANEESARSPPSKGRRQFLREQRAVVLAEPATRTPTLLVSTKAMDVLAQLGKLPWNSVLQHQAKLEMHPEHWKQCIRELKGLDAIREWVLMREGRGGKPKYYEALERGIALLKEANLSVADLPNKRGSFPHSIYSLWIGQTAESQGSQVVYDRRFGIPGVTKDPDVLITTREGKSIGAEVMLSGTAVENAKAILKATGIPGLHEIWCCCECKKFLDEIHGKLSAMGATGDRVRFRLLGEFMPKLA
jgi:hypothetical protein